MGNVVDHRGNRFVSRSEMCKFYGVHPQTYSSRIRRGVSVEEALTMELHQGMRVVKGEDGRLIRVIGPGGEEFRSQAELCRAYGISQSTLRYRLKRGLPVGEAIYRKPRGKAVVGPDGVRYASSVELCKAYGVDYGKFMHRRHQGLSLEMSLYSK